MKTIIVLLVVVLSSGDILADVTLSVSTLGKLKNCLTAVGIEPATFGLRIQCSTKRAAGNGQLACYISQLNLVASILYIYLMTKYIFND